MRGRRERLALCVYRDQYGIDTIVKFHRQVASERWPLDTDLAELERWVARTRSELMDRAPLIGATRVKTRGTLTADVETYLKTRKGRAGYKADRSHLKAWTARLGSRRRRQIRTADVNLAIADWRSTGVSAQTIIHRRRVLRALWHHFDGEKARTPVDDAQPIKRPTPHPVPLPIGTLRKVADALMQRTATYTKPRRKVYARFMVLATTLQRPIQMVRAQPKDVDLERRIWFVRGAKGEPSHPIPLNDDQVDAWRLFIAADAWGSYHGTSFRRALRAAGYPTTISTYNYRHTGAMDALELGADLGDVQGLLGHTEIETTRRTYGPLLVARQRRISDRLNGRLPTGSMPERSRDTRKRDTR